MITNVKARYANGTLVPLEPLDLEEGAEVTVTVEKDGPTAKDAPTADDAPPEKRGLAGIVAKVKEAQKSMPPDSWDDLPTDGAKNYKHYLYGHPKEED